MLDANMEDPQSQEVISPSSLNQPDDLPHNNAAEPLMRGEDEPIDRKGIFRADTIFSAGTSDDSMSLSNPADTTGSDVGDISTPVAETLPSPVKSPVSPPRILRKETSSPATTPNALLYASPVSDPQKWRNSQGYYPPSQPIDIALIITDLLSPGEEEMLVISELQRLLFDNLRDLQAIFRYYSIASATSQSDPSALLFLISFNRYRALLQHAQLPTQTQVADLTFTRCCGVGKKYLTLAGFLELIVALAVSYRRSETEAAEAMTAMTEPTSPVSPLRQGTVAVTQDFLYHILLPRAKRVTSESVSFFQCESSLQRVCSEREKSLRQLWIRIAAMGSESEHSPLQRRYHDRHLEDHDSYYVTLKQLLLFLKRFELIDATLTVRKVTLMFAAHIWRDRLISHSISFVDFLELLVEFASELYAQEEVPLANKVAFFLDKKVLLEEKEDAVLHERRILKPRF